MKLFKARLKRGMPFVASLQLFVGLIARLSNISIACPVCHYGAIEPRCLKSEEEKLQRGGQIFYAFLEVCAMAVNARSI
ncbi:MAG: hypothetical protein HOP19_10805 [Acidobacteria bacterium]|nr:hypothetical protein [Acidobacteriota bacterium]